jgi:tetratricopeptide (TPR) repeat protein
MPDHPRAHNNLGLICLELGQLDEAVAHFKAARDLDPGLTVVPLNWGIALARQGHFSAAVGRYREALRLDPGAAVTHDRLGQALAGLGRWDEAAGAFRRATDRDPKDKDFRADLGWALGHLGRTDESAKEYAAVTGADEEWPEKVRRSAWTWATDAHAARRNGFEALRRAEQACQARGVCDARFLDTLAAAYAEAGAMDAAALAARQALVLAGDDAELRAEVWQRLLGYLQRQPYRQPV